MMLQLNKCIMVRHGQKYKKNSLVLKSETAVKI